MRRPDFELSEILSVPTRVRTELLVMEALWAAGPLSTREICAQIPEEDRPSYQVIRLTIERLRSNDAVQKIKQMGNSKIFAASKGRDEVYRRLIHSFEGLFPVEENTTPPAADDLIQKAFTFRPRIDPATARQSAEPPPAGGRGASST
jgi:hypothetical protein